jgi:hypothetical protein
MKRLCYAKASFFSIPKARTIQAKIIGISSQFVCTKEKEEPKGELLSGKLEE